MKVFNVICLTLVIVGAIVWGIIGIFNFNLVDALFGTGSAFSRMARDLRLTPASRWYRRTVPDLLLRSDLQRGLAEHAKNPPYGCVPSSYAGSSTNNDLLRFLYVAHA